MFLDHFGQMYFSEDGDASTPPSTEETPTEELPAPETPSTDGGAKFTQEDVNRIIAQRLDRARDAHRQEVLRELGFDSVSAVHNALTDAQAKAAELEAKLDEYEKEKQALQERQEKEEKEEKLKTYLTENGVNPDYIMHALKLAYADGLTFQEDTDLETLRSTSPFLFANSGHSPDTPKVSARADSGEVNEDIKKKIQARFGRL